MTKREEVLEWLSKRPLLPTQPTTGRDLTEAMYTLSEMGFLDDLRLDVKLAIEIWRTVEAIRLGHWDNKLRM